MKYYDKKNNRLVYIEEKATADFWDKKWRKLDINRAFTIGAHPRTLVRRNTKKFLPVGSRILEGGCGIGQFVYGLQRFGYDAYGVDYAEVTIKRTKKLFPQLKLFVQDVRRLNFPDNFFDGYWSLGVIEHFEEGFGEVLKEAKRVIRPAGYFFLTFPWMSPLRKLKAKRGAYQLFSGNLKNKYFYQFILNDEEVKTDVVQYGFKLVLKKPFDSTKGMKDEISFLKPILQKVYDSQKVLAKGIQFFNSISFSKIASHSVLLVFKKEA